MTIIFIVYTRCGLTNVQSIYDGAPSYRPTDEPIKRNSPRKCRQFTYDYEERPKGRIDEQWKQLKLDWE